MKAQRHATVDDLVRARFERSSFILECDGEEGKPCASRGVFDSIKQTGGWLVDGHTPGGPVLILCPRCHQRRKKGPTNAR